MMDNNNSATMANNGSTTNTYNIWSTTSTSSMMTRMGRIMIPSNTSSSSPWLRKPLHVVHQQEQQQLFHLLTTAANGAGGSAQTSSSNTNSINSSNNTPRGGGAAAGGAAAAASALLLHNTDQHYQQQQQQQVAHHQSLIHHDPSLLVHLQRHLTLADLLGIGIGGTLGSGIFVLIGQVAVQYAGPATCLSFAISGIAAMFSAMCYAELASRIPATGATYVYTYVCLGEMMAVIAAACATLEYVFAGAAVARTWGDRIQYVLVASPYYMNNNKNKNNNNGNHHQLLQQQHDYNQLYLFFRSFLYNNNNSTLIIPTSTHVDGDTPTTTTTYVITKLVSFLVYSSSSSIVNIPAMFISLACTGLLIVGVQQSKNVTNFFTAFKLVLVSFMILGGLSLMDPNNLIPFVLPNQRWTGVLRGATSSFFGYLGYDEVCCVAGESIHPTRDLPRAVLTTLAVTMICYVLAALALAGMTPLNNDKNDNNNQESSISGFSYAFEQRNWPFAADITGWGEIITLPVVVLVSLMAQPRITYSMAQDGLLPPLFARTNQYGNLVLGTCIAGLTMTLLATFVPFTYLDDLISAGILLAFSMTNCCLVLLRCDAPTSRHPLFNRIFRESALNLGLERALLFYNGLCFLSSVLWTHLSSLSSASSDDETNSLWNVLKRQFNLLSAALSTIATLLLLGYIWMFCPQSKHFGGSIFIPGDTTTSSHLSTSSPIVDESVYFRTPWVPLFPCLGMAINWYLIAQLDYSGLALLMLYLGLTVTGYVFWCAPNSVGHNQLWEVELSSRHNIVNNRYDTLHGQDDDNDIRQQIPKHLTSIHKDSSNGTPFVPNHMVFNDDDESRQDGESNSIRSISRNSSSHHRIHLMSLGIT